MALPFLDDCAVHSSTLEEHFIALNKVIKAFKKAGITLLAVSTDTADGLAFTVRFSEPVTVSGSPQLSISVGGRQRMAAYVSGSGTDAIVFRYTLTARDGRRPTVKTPRAFAAEIGRAHV